MRYFVEGEIVERLLCHKCLVDLTNEYPSIVYLTENGYGCDYCCGEDYMTGQLRNEDKIKMVLILPEIKVNFLGNPDYTKLDSIPFIYGTTIIPTAHMPTIRRVHVGEHFSVLHHHKTGLNFLLCSEYSTTTKRGHQIDLEDIDSILRLYLYLQDECKSIYEVLLKNINDENDRVKERYYGGG